MAKVKISKQQLIEVLKQWHTKKLDNEQLQDWMVTHFDPPETVIGEGEPELIQEAMHVIMNEYELADFSKYKTESFDYAMQFLNCDEQNFTQKRQQFIHQGFTD